jgi:hypothetical protein
VLLTRRVIPIGDVAPRFTDQDQASRKASCLDFLPKHTLPLVRIVTLLEPLLPRKSAKPPAAEIETPIAKTPKKRTGKSPSRTGRKKNE